MDTVFKIIKGKREYYLGADHLGYDDTTFLATRILLKLITNSDVSLDETSFVNQHLYNIESWFIQDIEVVINDNLKTVYFDNLLDIMEIRDISFSDTKNINVEEENIFFKHEYSYDEFIYLFEILESIKNEEEVLINKKYLLRVSKSNEKKK